MSSSAFGSVTAITLAMNLRSGRHRVKLRPHQTFTNDEGSLIHQLATRDKQTVSALAC
jgi:hypothetical protein